MAVFAIKAATRLTIRRPQLPPFPKRHINTSPKPREDHASGTSIPVPNTVATLPLWQRLGPLSRGFEAYGRSQGTRPYTTQFVSSLVIYFLGDLSAQNINGDEYDYKRTLRAFVISAGSSIPSYKWYASTWNPYLRKPFRSSLRTNHSSLGSYSLETISTMPHEPSPSSPKSS